MPALSSRAVPHTQLLLLLLHYTLRKEWASAKHRFACNLLSSKAVQHTQLLLLLLLLLLHCTLSKEWASGKHRFACDVLSSKAVCRTCRRPALISNGDSFRLARSCCTCTARTPEPLPALTFTSARLVLQVRRSLAFTAAAMLWLVHSVVA